jgi:hypothetical protein
MVRRGVGEGRGGGGHMATEQSGKLCQAALAGGGGFASKPETGN